MSAQPNTTLRHALAQHFSLDELKLLCHDAGIDSERVPYAERGKDIFAFCIVETFRKQNRLPALRVECAKARDVGVDWAALTVEETVPAEWADLFSPKNLINTQGGAAFLGDMTVTGNVIGRDKIINYITNGLGDLPVRYDGNVRNFLSYYIGTDQQPAPFGGRATDLARLDDWLSDAAAPHYAFLAAPAGRGKSALLAHWVLQLQRRDDVHVVFFPISIRYGTNRDNVAFAALAARMAHVHGERVGRANDAQEYRSVFNDFAARPSADGKPVLVVLDALDEAAGWEAGADLFPNPPPPHLRVLVSARTRAGDADGAKWLTQLGWEQGRARLLTLGALDVNGVRDALQQIGNPLDALAPRYDIVNKLHELSEGDPLMVRLYVEALLPQGSRAASFTPDDLLPLKPGIKPFFDRWFDEQKKLWKGDGAQETTSRDRAVNGLLNACALAKGPLSNEDVLALCAQASSPEIAGTPDLVWAAEQINRFVIGDGSAQSGYVFSHPRLGYYFAERLTPKEREGWHERYLRYGRETLTTLNNGTLKPKDASPYAVRFYGAHLSEAKAEPQAFYDLMNEGWLRAWEWVDGTADGFLGDCDRAWEAAKLEGEPALGQMVRVILCHASVASLSVKVSGELLVSCVKTNVLSLSVALAMARLNPIPILRAESLIELSDISRNPQPILEEVFQTANTIENKIDRIDVYGKLADRLAFDLQAAILMEAIHLAQAIHDKHSRAYALTIIAKFFEPIQQSELLNEALRTAQSIQDEHSRSSILCVIAESLTHEQKTIVLNQAIQAMKFIKSEGSRLLALRDIVIHLDPEHIDLLTELQESARSFQNPSDQALALSAVANRLPPGQKSDLLAEVFQMALTVQQETDRANVLTAILEYLDEQEAHVLNEALHVTRAIQADALRGHFLRIIGEHIDLEFKDLLTDVIREAQAIPDGMSRSLALHAIGVRLASNQRASLLREALCGAQAIQDESDRAIAISYLTKQLPPEHKEVLIREALQVVGAIGDESKQAHSLSAIATSLATYPSLLAIAFEQIRTIKDEQKRAKTLIDLSAQLTFDQVGLVELALQIALAIKDDYARVCSLSAVAEKLAPDQRETMLNEVLLTARTIQDEARRAKALSMVAKPFTSERREVVLDEALSAARSIQYGERYIVESVSAFIDNFASAKKASLLSELLNITQSIEDEGDRIRALVAVASCSDDEQSDLFEDALHIAFGFQSKSNQAQALSAMAKHLSPKRKFAIQNIALKKALSIQYEVEQLISLSFIAGCLTSKESDISSKIFSAAKVIKDEWPRTRILTSLVACLPPGLSWVTDILILQTKGRRVCTIQILAAIAPAIAALGGERAVRETAQAILDTAKWWP